MMEYLSMVDWEEEEYEFEREWEARKEESMLLVLEVVLLGCWYAPLPHIRLYIYPQKNAELRRN